MDLCPRQKLSGQRVEFYRTKDWESLTYRLLVVIMKMFLNHPFLSLYLLWNIKYKKIIESLGSIAYFLKRQAGQLVSLSILALFIAQTAT